jgi:hypothetical protein
VIILPGLVDAEGHFAGFGAPEVLASSKSPQDIQTADLSGNGVADAVVVQQDGLQVIYGKPPTLVPNDTPQSARKLGTVVHVVEPALAISTSQEDAYYQLTVPTESVPGAGNEVIDFSGGFQYLEGAGLGMEVLDASGQVVGSGARFRIDVAQGATLTLHIFGARAADGNRGAGAYALDIDVLPQIVSVQAQSVLPGAPVTSVVITFQGDRLDPAAAQGPANYTVLWHPPGGTGDGARVIPLSPTSLPVVYDASANLNVASGLTYPTAVRQTVTLLFDQPLPPGNYEVVLSPAIQAAGYNADEASLLAGDSSFADHPVVSARNGIIVNGGAFAVTNLVTPAAAPADPSSVAQGTPFLTQLQGDLGAMLDNLLTQKGDDPTITAALNSQILARFAPSIVAGAGGTSVPTSYLVVWFDPVSLDLQSAQGQGVSYSLATNALSSNLGQTFVSVGGNVEVVVTANAAGSFNLDVGNVPGSARGGAVVLSANGSQEFSFTDALREGIISFQLNLSDSAAPAGGPATGPADAIGSTSPGTALAAGFSQQAALALTIGIGMIGSPSGELDTTAGPGGGPGLSANSVAGVVGQSLSPNREPSGSAAGDDRSVAETETTPFLKKLLSAIDEALGGEGANLGKRIPGAKSTLRFLERMTVLSEALGWHRPPIVRLLLRKLIDVVERPGVPAALRAVNPARAPRPGLSPTSPVATGSDEAQRWDEALERLTRAGRTTAFHALDTPTREPEQYLAALLLSIAADQAGVRTSTRLHEKVRHV